jgi:hypothetical protein
MVKKKKEKPLRARRTPKVTRADSPTASRARKSRVPERRPVFEQWATMSPPDRFSLRQPRVCLWGDQPSAVENCDPDERVCLVRVEVLEVLDE